MTRPYTTDEIKKEFLSKILQYIDYWEHLGNQSTRDRLEGLAFSILVIIDGVSDDLPGFVLAPSPHPDDKAYCQENGENWYPDFEGEESDIGGDLHGLFARMAKDGEMR